MQYASVVKMLCYKQAYTEQYYPYHASVFTSLNWETSEGNEQDGGKQICKIKNH